MKPGLCMVLSVIVWGTYPLVVSYTLFHLNSVSLAFYVQATAASASLIALIIKDRNFCQKIFQITFLDGVSLCLAGCFMSGFIFLLYYSLENAPKIHVVIILEIWPLMSLLLAPILIQKEWKAIGIGEVVLVFIGFVGVAIALSEGKFSNFTTKMQTGHLTALIAALCTSIGTLLITRNAEKIDKYNPINAILMSQFISRTLSSFILLAFAISINSLKMIQLENIVSVIYLGGFVLVLGAMLFSFAIKYSKSPSIVMLWFIYPVISVVLLYFFGFGHIYKETLIGAIMVVSVNILNSQLQKAKRNIK